MTYDIHITHKCDGHWKDHYSIQRFGGIAPQLYYKCKNHGHCAFKSR